MTGTELFEALSFVDEGYIMEAETARMHKIPWMKYLSVAACLCILIVGAFAMDWMASDKMVPEAAAPPAAPEAAPEAAPPVLEDALESAGEEEPLTGELVDVLHAKVRVVKVLEDGNFEAIVEADEPMEMDTTVIVRAGKGTVFHNISVTEGAVYEIYDATYAPETNMLYVSRLVPLEGE